MIQESTYDYIGFSAKMKVV